MAILDDITPPVKSGQSGLHLIPISLFLILIWGSAFTMIGAAVRTLSPDWLVSYRMIAGATLILIYCFAKGYRLPPMRDKRWVWYSLIAIFGTSLPFALIANGQKTVDSGLSSILIGTMPLITIILAHFFTPEKLTPWKFFGFVIGFIGIVVLFLPPSFSFALVADWKAQTLILLGAVSYAVTTIIASRAPATPSLIAATMMLLMGALFSTLWAISVAGPPPMPDKIALLCVLGLALGSTAAGTVAYLWVIDVAGPSVIARINYFTPICSVILGVQLMREGLDWRIFFALFVIIFGVIISRFGHKNHNSLKPKTQVP